MPVQSEVQEELLRLLARHARVPSTTNVYEELAEAMHLSRKQLSKRREDGRLHWPNLVQYAVERLKDDGYLVPTTGAGKGNWILTDKGRAEAAQLERIRAGLPRGTDRPIEELL
jgi:Mrr N-terminal domain